MFAIFGGLLRMACGAAVMAFAAGMALAATDDFRMESRVYVKGEAQTASDNVTLFYQGRVYDFLGTSGRVAVFDPARKRFLLADGSRNVRSELPLDDVLTFTMKLQVFAAQGSNELLRFAASPKLETTVNKKSGDLHLASEFMTYRLSGLRPPSSNAAQQVREFSDWYSRLNAMLSPGAMPPFPRLVVNDELARRGLVAKQVDLVIPKHPKGLAQPIALRSEHRYAWRLEKSDIERITDADSTLKSFRRVNVAEYRGRTETIRK